MLNEALSSNNSNSSISCSNSYDKGKRGYLELFKSYVQNCIDREINPSLNEVLNMHKKVMINYTDETDEEKFKNLMTCQFELVCTPLLKKTTLKADNCIARSTVEGIIQGALKKIYKNTKKRVVLKTQVIATRLLEIEIESFGEDFEPRLRKKAKRNNEGVNDSRSNSQQTNSDDYDGDIF